MRNAVEKILSPLNPPLRLGHQMAAAIVAELRAMTLDARALVKALTNIVPDAHEQLAMDAPPDGGTVSGRSQMGIEALKAKYQQRFASLAEEWSSRMIGEVVTQSSAQLTLKLKDVASRMAIQSTMSTPRMRAVVEAAAQSSVGLITRIPEKYLAGVQTAVMNAITTGSGLGELVPYLTKKYKGDVRHAHLTALDQIRKVSESVNAARVQSLGVEEYEWLHTGGERYPRHLHVKYHGKRFRYDDPPIIQYAKGKQPEVRGKPGDLPGCRCRQRPILNFAKMIEKAA